VSPSRTKTIALLSVAALAGSTATAVSATGHDRKADGVPPGPIVRSTLAPSSPGDPVLHAVAPGGLPWALTRGDARLRGDGSLRVRVRGLVLPGAPGNGTPGPVTTVSASLYCGTDTTAVGTTPAAPIARDGDARMEGELALPAKCVAPVVLVHPNGNVATYIAATGFGA
jgi:hypothetical protein